MAWKSFFFSFDGRIPRREWWLGTILIIAVSVLLSVVFNPERWQPVSPRFGQPNLADVLFSLAFVIPQTALSVRRFNDRDRLHWVPYAYALMIVAIVVAEFFGLIFRRGGDGNGGIDVVLRAAYVFASAVILVENGMLRGTSGPNAHGPDPLANRSHQPQKHGGS
ncbi:MAG: DUF805 domain-containing protein [Hyphomicrobiaceae bacterium]|nr:DUF805 domain-containing protein [Hyphomicrobiaceae bacterium]